MARRIVRTSDYTPPSGRTVARRTDGKLTERQKYLNSLGTKGEFEWNVTIIYEDGEAKSKTMFFDHIDDAHAWARNKCQPGWQIWIDGEKVVER